MTPRGRLLLVAEAAAFIALHSRDKLAAHTIAHDVEALQTCGRKLHALFEEQCNGIASDVENDVHEAKIERVCERVRIFAERLDVPIRIQRDPRGAPLQILGDDGRFVCLGL